MEEILMPDLTQALSIQQRILRALLIQMINLQMKY